MNSREDARRSLEARIDELEQKVAEFSQRTTPTPSENNARLREQLSSLNTRLAAARARLQQKADADDEAQDAAIAELGHVLDGMYQELMTGPK